MTGLTTPMVYFTDNSKTEHSPSIPVMYSFIFEPLHEKTNNLGFRSGLTQTSLYSHRNWLEIKKVEELYYPCSEIKGAYQLRSYCEADLRLCFRICRLLVCSCGGSFGTVRQLVTTFSGNSCPPSDYHYVYIV